MKNKAITVFFILLTLPIGLVSGNLPLSSYAQSNSLAQTGDNDDAEQQKNNQSLQDKMVK